MQEPTVAARGTAQGCPEGCSGFHSTALDLGGWHTAKGYLWGHSEEKTDVNMAMRSSFHREEDTQGDRGRVEGTHGRVESQGRISRGRTFVLGSEPGLGREWDKWQTAERPRRGQPLLCGAQPGPLLYGGMRKQAGHTEQTCGSLPSGLGAHQGKKMPHVGPGRAAEWSVDISQRPSGWERGTNEHPWAVTGGFREATRTQRRLPAAAPHPRPLFHQVKQLWPAHLPLLFLPMGSV